MAIKTIKLEVSKSSYITMALIIVVKLMKRGYMMQKTYKQFWKCIFFHSCLFGGLQILSSKHPITLYYNMTLCFGFLDHRWSHDNNLHSFCFYGSAK